MKKLALILTIFMLFSMQPMWAFAESIPIDDDLIYMDLDEWYVGDNAEPFDGNLPVIDDSVGDSDMLDIGNPNESSDVNISIPEAPQLYNIFQGTVGVRAKLGITNNENAALQGACSDGEFVYFAFHIYNKDEKYTTGQRIVCSRINADGTYDIVNAVVRSFTDLDHANSLTYNSKTDQIVVANCIKHVQDVEDPVDMHNRLTVINAAYLRGETNTKVSRFRFIPCQVTAIEYDKYEDSYIVAVADKRNAYVILNNNFQLEKKFEINENNSDYSVWSRQEIWCDSSNAYALFSYPYKNESGQEKYKNVIVSFNKKTGTAIEEINIKIGSNVSTTLKYEVENIFKVNDKLYLGFYVDNKDGYYRYADITTSTFKVEYCENYNRADDVNAFMSKPDTEKKSSLVISGVTTKLMPNTFLNSEYKFKGWALYRPDISSWYYLKSDGTKAWCTTAPAGSQKFICSDEQNVSATCPSGEKVIMVAQWELTNKFFITFISNDSNDTKVTQECVYGTSNTLRACSFTSNHSGGAFLGWHAYSVEYDKWYYESSDKSSHGWYKEGSQPNGYKKYIYLDQQSVSKTAPKGGNIQMFAFWNEFKIYYFAGLKKISYNMILTPSIGTIRNAGESGQNNLKSYNGSNKTDWYLYCHETGKWYFEDSSNTANRGWYKFGSQPSNYQKYINDDNYTYNTVPAGYSLTLCWTQGTLEDYDF